VVSLSSLVGLQGPLGGVALNVFGVFLFVVPGADLGCPFLAVGNASRFRVVFPLISFFFPSF